MSKIGKQAYDELKADERRKAIADIFRDSDERALRYGRAEQRHLFVNDASKGISEVFRAPWLSAEADEEFQISLDAPIALRPFRAFYDPFRTGWHIVPWGTAFVAINGVKIGQLVSLAGTKELHVRMHVSSLNRDPTLRSRLVWKVVTEELLDGVPQEQFGWCLLDLENLREGLVGEVELDETPEETIKTIRERFGR